MDCNKEITLADLLDCMKEQKEETMKAKQEMNDKLENFMTKIDKNANENRKESEHYECRS